MRTTIDLDEAILSAAKALARDEGVSIGAILSRLARRGLESHFISAGGRFPAFAVTTDARPISLHLVNDNRDGE